MNKNTKDLDKHLQSILSAPDFLEMRGIAKEVPIFIQTYSPSDEDDIFRIVKGIKKVLEKKGIRVKHIDLFELVIQLLEQKGYLDAVIEDEMNWSKSDLLDTLQNVVEPTSALVPKLIKEIGEENQVSLITGSGRIYPFLRTHSILEALQPAMIRHPLLIFFPGEYNQDSDGGSFLRLFGTKSSCKIETPHYRATNLDYFSTTIS